MGTFIGIKFLVCLFLNLIWPNFANATLTGDSIDKEQRNISVNGRPNTTEESYENITVAFNNSETTLNVTYSTNLETTSVSPSVLSFRHETKNLNKKRNKLCECDLTCGSCDVNCCCDLDCSSEDNLTFDHCAISDPPSLPNLRYCVRTRLMYENNGPYEVDATSDNLLCIVRDNVEQQYKYRTLSGLHTVDQLKSIATEKHFSWGDPTEDLKHVIPVPKEMKVGNELYRYVVGDERHQFQVWHFPSSLFSDECQSRQNVQYLIDQKSACSLTMDLTASPPCSHRSLNAATHHGFYLLKNSALLNESAGVQIESLACQENLTGPCILVTPTENYTCLNDDEIPEVCPLLNGQLPSPAFNETSGVCHNVVTKVTYRLVHNGTSGLVNATVRFRLETIDAQSQFVNQVFESSYLWNKSLHLNESFERSGNPGYIFGRPVLAGRKTRVNTTDKQIDVIDMNHDATKWLTISKAHHNGFCKEIPENRAPVTFGENLVSACILKIAPEVVQTCENLQKYILSMINGTNQPDSVGYFGNSNPHNVSEWIPVQFGNLPTVKQSDRFFCKSVITDLHIDIYHTLTGTMNAPQQKIVGIIFHYHNPQDIHLNCTDDVSDLCSKELILTSSVNFIDISQPAMQLFGQPPSLHVSIPGDFFYPFTFSSQAQFFGNAFLLTLHILFVVTF